MFDTFVFFVADDFDISDFRQLFDVFCQRCFVDPDVFHHLLRGCAGMVADVFHIELLPPANLKISQPVVVIHFHQLVQDGNAASQFREISSHNVDHLLSWYFADSEKTESDRYRKVSCLPTVL